MRDARNLTLVRSTQIHVVRDTRPRVPDPESVPADLLPCPCCGHRTLPELGQYELCPVCFWEDDPNQSRQPSSTNGANGKSLVESQQSYLSIGAMDELFLKKVRSVRPSEAIPDDWMPSRLDLAD